MISYDGVYVTFRDNELDMLLNNPRGAVGRYMRERARLHVQLSKRKVGIKTGATLRSIHYRHARDARGQFVEVIASSRVAYMHHEGTRPHMIAAAPGRVMRFAYRGQAVYATRVTHPGTRPNRFLTDTLIVWRT